MYNLKKKAQSTSLVNTMSIIFIHNSLGIVGYTSDARLAAAMMYFLVYLSTTTPYRLTSNHQAC